MDEITFGNVMRNIGLVAGIIGMLLSLDLLGGAKVLKSLKRILDRSFDFDKIIIKISSVIRKLLDSIVKFDEAVLSTQSRVIWGVLFLLVSVTMLLVTFVKR